MNNRPPTNRPPSNRPPLRPTSRPTPPPSIRKKRTGGTGKARRRAGTLAGRVLLCLATALLTALAGWGLFCAVCRHSAEWSVITDALPDTDLSPAEPPPAPPYGDGFAADMSGYEAYINPIREQRDAFLRLINRENAVTSSYRPEGLVALPASLTGERGEEILLNLYAAKSLEAMFLEMQTQKVALTDPRSGQTLTVGVGYVSYVEQEEKFAREVERIRRNDPTLSDRMAEDLAEVTVPRPGRDEHQSGLCFDFRDTGGVPFEKSEVFGWLEENAWKFGFILRYPKNKAEEVGTSFKPFHFRYVGRCHAKAMQSEGLCLEEYLAGLSGTEPTERERMPGLPGVRSGKGGGH